LRLGNRESTIKRKLKFLKAVGKWLGEKCNINRVFESILKSSWCDKSKNYALVSDYRRLSFHLHSYGL